jgi:hypothetical protein
MTIASAITAAQGRVADCYTSVNTMGGTLPATQDLTNLPSAIESIPTGGGGGDTIFLPNESGSTISAGDKVLFTLGVKGSDTPETFTTAYYLGYPNFNPICVLDNYSFIVSGRTGSSYNGYLFQKTNNTWTQGSISTLYGNTNMAYLTYQYFSTGYIPSCNYVNNNSYLVSSAGLTTAINDTYRYIGDFATTSYVAYSTSWQGNYSGRVAKWDKGAGTATSVLTISGFATHRGLYRIFGSRLLACDSQNYKVYTISDSDTFTLLSQGTFGTDNKVRIIGATGLQTGDVLFMVNDYSDNYNNSGANTNPPATAYLFCFKVQSDGTIIPYEDTQLKIFESTPCYVAYDNRSNILSIGTKDEVYFYEFDTLGKIFNRINITHSTLPTPYSNVPLRVQMTPDKSTFIVYAYSSSANPVYVYTLTNLKHCIVPNSDYHYDLVTSFTGIATGETDEDDNYEISTVLPPIVDSKIITDLEPDEVIIKGEAE